MPEDDDRSQFVGRQITAIVPVGREHANVSIRVGRRTVAVIPAIELHELELAVGTELTLEQLDCLDELARVVKARAHALRLLNARPYSTRNLSRKLLLKGYSKEVIAQVVERLTRVGLLNDEQFGRELIRQLRAGKPAGDRLLASKLAQHGIDTRIAQRLISESAGEQVPAHEDPAIEKLVVRKLASMSHLAPEVRARRIFGLLARRGFDYEQVRQIVDRHLSAEPD